MNRFAKSALVLGAVGAIALGSVTASEARSGRWVAGAAGVAAGVAIGAAAASSAYYNGGYYYGPGYAYAPGYDAYAYEPAYTYAPAPVYVPAPAYGYYGRPDLSTQSWPPHYDPGAGYNSNTLAPWQDRKMQGTDY